MRLQSVLNYSFRFGSCRKAYTDFVKSSFAAFAVGGSVVGPSLPSSFRLADMPVVLLRITTV